MLESPVLQAYEQKRSQFSIKEGQSLEGEIWVFHGTSPQSVDAIVSEGFKVGGVQTAVVNGTVYGAGVYTATGPSTPIGYSRGCGQVCSNKLHSILFLLNYSLH